MYYSISLRSISATHLHLKIHLFPFVYYICIVQPYRAQLTTARLRRVTASAFSANLRNSVEKKK